MACNSNSKSNWQLVQFQNELDFAAQTAVAIGITARFARQKAAIMGLELRQFDLELE